MVAYPAIPNHYAIVFDNLNAVGIIGDRFQFRLPTNKLVGPLGEDSQFEGVAMMPENGHVLLLHEALEHDGMCMGVCVGCVGCVHWNMMVCWERGGC